MSWQQPARLGNYFRIKHGYAFKSEDFASEGRFVLLTPGNFNEAGGFRRRIGKDRYFIGDIPESYVLAAGDLIVAMTEQGAGLLGSSAVIPAGEAYLHNQRIGLVHSIDAKQLNLKFLYYLFNTAPVRGQINASATGTKVRHTAPERIYRVEATLPDVSQQERIAAILSTYDDLIENNRQRIGLLGEAARQLYKEWFVRFRFPGHEHVKILNGVPEGWGRETVASLSSYLSRGITPSYDDEAPGLIINQKCIRDSKVNLGPARPQSKMVPENKLVRKFDVLVNSTGAGTLGRVAQNFYENENLTTDSHVTIVRPKKGVAPVWFGLLLILNQNFIATLGRGATNQTELSKDDIGAISVNMPPTVLLYEFEGQVGNMAEQIVIFTAQNAALTKARDLLLPRLMNGSLTV